MNSPNREPVGLPFDLYDYDQYHSGIEGKVNELIEAGRLPFDTFFRLASVGYKAEDTDEGYSIYLNYILMHDMVEHADAPDLMRPETQEVLYDELPDAIVDVNSSTNYRSYAKLEPMYYRRIDLARAIQRRRLDTGQALPEAPYDRRLHVVHQDEWSRCRRIAWPIWRLMVQRFHPEWLETPEDYYPSAYIGMFAVVYSISEPRMKRGIVSHAVFSDPLVLSIYEEAVATGVRGIGPLGKEDLRLLLLDEHPELLEGHELPYNP